MRWILALVFALLATHVALAQPDNPAQSVELQDSIRLRNLSTALHMYGEDHNGLLPPDLASTLDYLGADNANQEYRTKNIADTLIAPGIPAPKVPGDAKADWVNQNSSYAYLGGGGINIEDVPQWGDVVIAHLKLDAGHPSGDNPADQMFTLAFMDGHVTLTTKAEAQRQIAESQKILDAVRTGGPFPDAVQTMWDLGVVVAAVQGYAKEHKGELPPDLGSALAYVPKEKRLTTPAQRAGIFLSPASRRNTHIPDVPTAEWVTRNASFVYLGAAPAPDAKLLVLDRIEDALRIVLVHGRLDAKLSVVRSGQETQLIPLATVRGSTDLASVGYAEAIIAESKKVLEATRNGTPLPDYQHTLRDLRLLLKAINAYAAANNGQLPPDLGSTLAFLPNDDLPTPADKARVYLSPRVERLAHLPDELTPGWVNKNASYVYLAAGASPIKLADLRQRGKPITTILHAPLNEVNDVAFSFVPDPPYTHPVVVTASVSGVTYDFPEGVKEWIAESRQRIEELRAK